MSNKIEKTAPIVEFVDLHGQVALKIIKHCQDSMQAVTGVLLGLDVETTLEVTSCFPSLLPEENEDIDPDNYQLEMMKCLQVVNVDSYMVGWYQSALFSSFLNDTFVETQYEHQEKLQKCVCIVYDPLLSSQGNLCLKAFRLTDQFMKFYRKREFSKQALKEAKLCSFNVYEEIPVRIHNTNLITGALLNLEQYAKQRSSMKYDLLEFSSATFLEKNVEYIIEGVDDLNSELNRLNHYQRLVNRQKMQQDIFLQKRKQENKARAESSLPLLTDEDLENNPLFKPIPEPNRLDPLLISNQILTHCKQLSEISGQSLYKVYMVNGLNTDSQ